MKKIFLLPLLLIACSSGLETRCYELVGDPDGTQLILEGQGESGKLTITDPVGGQPVEALGTIEEGVFTYTDAALVDYDGTRLNFNEEKAWYSNSEFLEGLEGTRVTCD